jgi:hypothetical protein
MRFCASRITGETPVGPTETMSAPQKKKAGPN